MQGAGSKVRASWVRPETMHLTLKFLGEVDEEDLELLTRALAGPSEKTAPFTLRSGALGAFPSMRRPRSLWLAIEESGELQALRELIEEALFNLGFKGDKKNFTPHLTLCRIRSKESSMGISRAAERVKVEKKVAFVAQRFVLYKSTLTPSGAVHSLISEFPLTGS